MYNSDKVCNLINSHEGVLSITTPQVSRGPFSLIIPPVDLSLHMNSKAPACLVPCGLQVGTLKIDTRFAQYWDPQPSWSSLRERNGLDQDDLQIVLETLARFAPPESLAGLVVNLPRPRSTIEEKILVLASEPANQLIKGLVRDDVNLCVRVHGASRLAGLGFGYTPDGDDWILGSLFAAWIIKPHQEAKRLSTAIAEAAIPLTTPISAAWIRAASRGECAEPWHDFFSSMASGNEIKIREVSKRLISLGHSSGASAVAGFLAFFKGIACGL